MASNQMTSVIDLVNSEASRLRDFLAELDERAWSQDSACAGWKVGDVAAHLAIASETWASSLTRAVAGDAGPPAGPLGLDLRGFVFQFEDLHERALGWA